MVPPKQTYTHSHPTHNCFLWRTDGLSSLTSFSILHAFAACSLFNHNSRDFKSEFGCKGWNTVFTHCARWMRVPIQKHVSLCISLRSRNFFTHRAVVATSAQCFGIGTRIHFEQLREDCVSALSKRRVRRWHGALKLATPKLYLVGLSYRDTCITNMTYIYLVFFVPDFFPWRPVLVLLVLL